MKSLNTKTFILMCPKHEYQILFYPRNFVAEFFYITTLNILLVGINLIAKHRCEYFNCAKDVNGGLFVVPMSEPL